MITRRALMISAGIAAASSFGLLTEHLRPRDLTTQFQNGDGLLIWDGVTVRFTPMALEIGEDLASLTELHPHHALVSEYFHEPNHVRRWKFTKESADDESPVIIHVDPSDWLIALHKRASEVKGVFSLSRHH